MASQTLRPLPDLRTRKQIEDEARRVKGFDPRLYSIHCEHRPYSIEKDECRGGDHCEAMQEKLAELRVAWRAACA